MHAFGLELEVKNSTEARVEARISRAGIMGTRTVREHGGLAETILPPLAACEFARNYIATIMVAQKAAGADGGAGAGMHMHVSNASLKNVTDEAGAEAFCRASIAHTARTGRVIFQDETDLLDDPMTCEELQDIMVRYTAQGCVVNTTQHHSRTGNHMAQELDLPTITNARPTISSLRAATHGKFSTVNLEPWASKGTVEFRQAIGTVEIEKCWSWVEFILNLVKWTRTERYTPSQAQTHTTPRTGASAFAAQARRIRLVYDMFRTETGATTFEVMMATGVAETSVRRMVSEIRNRIGDSALVTHTQQAQGHSYGDGTDYTRYQIQRTWSDGATAPVKNDGVNPSIWAGLTDDQFDWWQDRIDVLAGRTPPS